MVYFVYFIIGISFFDTFSQLPVIAPYAQELGAGSLLAGLAVGMYSFSNLIGNVFAGPWIDRLGRKKILVLGMGTAGVSLLLYTLVASPEQLLAVRFLHGVSGGLLVPAVFAYLGDRSTDRATKGHNGKTMALSGAAIGAAAVLGPAFGGLVKGYIGIQWVFLIVSFLFITCALCVQRFLPESLSSFAYKKSPPSTGIPVKTDPWLCLLKNGHLANAYISSFGHMFTLGIVAYMLPLKTQGLNLGPAAAGLLMSVYGMAAIVLFILPTNRISDRFGRVMPMFIGQLIIALSLILLSIFSVFSLLVTAMIVYGIGFSLLFPAMTASVVDQTQTADRGKAFGLFYAFFSLGVVLGPFFVGLLNVNPNTGLLIGASGMLICALILFFRRYPNL